MDDFIEESTTYQYILELGGIRFLRGLLLRQGAERYGPHDAATEAAINGISDLKRLERMAVQMLHANSWQELLATP